MSGKRRVCGLALAVLIGIAVVLIPHDAWGKTPPFRIEVPDRSPEAGEPIALTLRFTRPPSEQPPSEYLGDRLDGYLAAFPGTELIPPRAIAISLHRTGQGTYQGEVVFPRPGPWRLWSFPAVVERAGIAEHYTDFIEVHVRESTTERSLQLWPLAVAILIGGGLPVLVLVRRRLRAE